MLQCANVDKFIRTYELQSKKKIKYARVERWKCSTNGKKTFEVRTSV